MINRIRQILLTFLCLAFALGGPNLFAQNHIDPILPTAHHPVLSAIQKEVAIGNISKEEALLQSIYAGFKPERLDTRFRTSSDQLIKCLTPVLAEYEQMKDQMNPATVSEIETLLSVETSAETRSHTSPSGNFILYYETTGLDAVPLEDLDNSGVPDYIEKAAFAADSSYRYEVLELGFMDFLKDEPYVIYFQNFQFYGTTRASGSTTTINIHNDFGGFPGNTHPEGDQTGALYATIAHEVKHAIQYTNNRWKGDSGNAVWIEMDATLMEEVVFDDVNDYYNYIMNFNSADDDWDQNSPHSSSIFGSPNSPIPGSYNHITWALYFAESYGMQFWVDVWKEIRADYLNKQDNEDFISYLDAIERVLIANNQTFPQEHINNHLWHMTAGPDFMIPKFGFQEKENYPSSRFIETLFQPPDSLTNQLILAKAANYIHVIPSNIIPGQPTFLLDATVNGVGLGVIGFFRNGEIDTQFIANPNSKSQALQTTWSWDNLTDIRIAVVNTHRDSSGTYNLTVTSTIPDEDTITQNYPNPFNPVTNIRFSLSEAKRVKVEVYDRIGRQISTLIDDRLNRGFHTIQFDASDLASGVYFYRIITDQTVSTKKMVLIK
ncbi:T9SS type A sorting domain-containing protein [Rhodohalobacter sp. 614A]|uniref:T9SS type A sorting domain-containing protein n=1 Tax=Rhodohalobacter sp. 614A TaxID=2908649 RepID=UPI001F2F763A|nr:T9SS type A sorting domain-containing protein [Rhodohalobacter sp. 614A]